MGGDEFFGNEAYALDTDDLLTMDNRVRKQEDMMTNARVIPFCCWSSQADGDDSAAAHGAERGAGLDNTSSAGSTARTRSNRSVPAHIFSGGARARAAPTTAARR